MSVITTRLGFLTKHKKGAIVAPILAEALGWELLVTEDFDTDQLGTFSGEVERTLSPLDCATEKAKKACFHGNFDIGLGSEGSFGEGPYGAIVPWHTEILACFSQSEGWRVVGFAQGPSCHRHKVCVSTKEALSFFRQLPDQQGLIVSPEEGPMLAVFKGIVDEASLLEVVTKCLMASPSKRVMVEYDLRAHMCPERQIMIADAAHDLAKRLQSRCPKCDTPGFCFDESESGLPCRWCGTPTHQIKQRTSVCQGCEFRQTQKVDEKEADPMHCPVCNP